MGFKFCTKCGEKLGEKEVGDEGILPYCYACEKPYFDIFNICVLVAIIKNNKIALLKQDYVSTTNWGLVAGYIKKGENAEETLVREVEEETGLKVNEYTYISSYFHDKSKNLMLGFIAYVDDGDFSISKEVDNIKWFTVKEAESFMRDGSTAQKHFRNVKKYLKDIEYILI